MLDLVVLCAEWCGVCRELRIAIEGLEGVKGRVYWIDIEEGADLVDALEVETFPTIAIVDRSGCMRFAGTVEPSVAVIGRIAGAALAQPPMKAPPGWAALVEALPTLQPIMER